MIIVSACLAGCRCRYNGEARTDPAVLRARRRGKVLPLCPERLGGLGTPREPAVIEPPGRVFTPTGEVTGAFRKGSGRTLLKARTLGITSACLKERSPSCGTKTIYCRGAEAPSPGQGLTADLLHQKGLTLASEEEGLASLYRQMARKVRRKPSQPSFSSLLSRRRKRLNVRYPASRNFSTSRS